MLVLRTQYTIAMVAGQTISHYRITEKLGEGGMGVVYKAEDTQLRRTVALKFLTQQGLSDPETKARLIREAQAAASLDHPNICSVYGIHEESGRTFIAMAHIDGVSLADKIKQRPLAFEEALSIAIQMGEGLQEAHEQGVVHRDIKPANIMLTRKDRVKIMDFGLAYLAGRSKLTKSGTTLGTPVYMSPEQALGQNADRRSDIWSLGVVLYEMIAGQPPFNDEHQQAIIYSIINEAPEPLTARRTGLPVEIDRIIGKVLAKKLDERYQHVDDLAVDLKNLREKPKSGRSAILRTSASATTAGAHHAAPAETETAAGAWAQHAVPLQGTAAAPTWKRHLPWALFAVTALALLAVSSLHFREAPPPEIPPLEFTLSLPEGVQPTTFSLSPDGRYLVMATAATGGPGPLWVRPLDSLEARALTGTEGAFYPFWSPDSRNVGFFAGGKLKKVALAGGPPQSLCDAESGRGGSWSRDGVILFAPSPFGELQRVAEGGGEPVAVTRGNDPEQARSRRFPNLLPDGRHFLYTDSRGTDVERPGVYLGSLAGEAPRLILPHRTNAVYVPGPDGGPDGHILFVLEETLMAQPFDAGRLELSGDGFPVADPVGSWTIQGFYSFSASARGALAYVTSSFVGTSQLTWFDRRGKLLTTVGDPGRIGNVTLSPDGARAAIDMRAVGSNSPDIWLVEMSRGTFSRFSSDPEAEFHPVWSPAGDRIAYTMAREGRFHVYHKDAGGGGEAEPMPLIRDSMTGEQLNDWSPDGRFLVVMGQGTKLLDLWVLPVSGEEQPFPFLATEFPESAAQFSPSGNWLAYQSSKSGRSEIYLRPFPKSDREWKISTGGGQRPRWRGDGRELYFIAPDGNLMAAGVRTGETVEAGVPAPLFKTNLTLAGFNTTPYDVTADGQRFLVLVQSEDRAQQRPLTVTTNWLAKARR